MFRYDLPSFRPTGAGSTTGDDDDLRAVPAFTAEDERREIESLTLAELVRVQSDLAGLAPALLESLQPPSSSSAANTAIIAALEAELHKLPQTDTEAYYRAVEKCPNQVGPERKMIFLEASKNDVQATAAHLAEYWKARVELFGSTKAYLPMTLDGAMREEKMNLASWCVWRLLSHPDAAGRPVLFFCPGRRNFAEYSTTQELYALWYFLETIVEEDSLRKNGFVILADMRNFDWQRSSKKMIQFFARMVSFMPTTLRGSHLCYPHALVHYLLFPLIKTLIPRSIRLRFKTHPGTPGQVMTELSGFCLPMERVPVDLGGLLPVNSAEWVIKRQVLETLRQHSASSVAQRVAQRRAHPQQLPAISNTASALLSAPIGQLQRPAQMNQSLQPFLRGSLIPRQPQPLPQPNQPPSNNCSSINDNALGTTGASDGYFKYLSDYQLYEQIVQERHTKSTGRKSDPRMNKALVLTLQNPEMSRTDAIIAGGFVFPDLESSSRTNVDSERISLKQRQDQLSRRLREVKKWIQSARRTGELSGS